MSTFIEGGTTNPGVQPCPYCGVINGHTLGCPNSPSSSVATMPRGWKCPQCGTVYAPFVSECPKCKGREDFRIYYDTATMMNPGHGGG